MDDSGVGNTVPTAAQHNGLQVSAAAVEVEVENRLDGGGGGDDGGHEGAVVAVENGGGDGGFRERRKRGRPRKQLGEIQPEFRVVAEDSGCPQKRGRGRPKGSGKWQTLAASFGLSGAQGGSNFTPYVIDIQAGENIVQRIWSFSQMTSDSICILSASGSISTAQIFLPASRGRILKCEGHFTIVCLNGSHTYDEKGAGKVCLLSVQLANSDGHFYGGAVAGSLIAAGPTQIILSTFRQNLRQQARVRPPSITAPKHNDNNGTVAAEMQAENGENEEVRDERAIFNVSHLSPAAPAAPEWKSLQPPSNV